MSGSRISLIEQLKKYFEDENIKSTCLTSSRLKINNRFANRVFDDFPNLLQTDDITFMKDSYEKILSTLKFSSKDLTLRKTDQEKIMQWEKKFIFIACTELLNDQDQIKSELLDLLEWNDLKNKFTVSDIICAFVGTINQQTMNELKPVIENDLLAHGAICNFINPNYRRWVVDFLHKNSTIKEKLHHMGLKDIFNIPNKHPITTAATLSMVAAASTGLTFYAAYKTANNWDSDHQPSCDFLSHPFKF